MAKDKYLFFVSAIFSAFLCSKAATSPVVPALFVFGDSTADVGNNNFLPSTLAKANFQPYGIDYPGGIPTGRFSNGYNGVDYLAKVLGFTKSPLSYLSLRKVSDANRGSNFASGGSGIFDSTGANFSIPFDQQIKYFHEFSLGLRALMGEADVDLLVKKSLFYISTGNNDMISFFVISGVRNQSQADIFIGQLTNQFKRQLEALYNAGARKFIVPSSSLVGCIPILRVAVPNGDCVEYLNNLSRLFNKATQIALNDLSSTHKDFSYSFINVYDFVSVLSSEPQKFGFTETMSACCGSGRFNARADCLSNSTYCANRAQYFYWDRFHATQALSRVISSAVYNDQRYASPLTLGQLVRG
ncbi:GDSL esterase/lipase At5g55050-like [Wolffia australiana]